MVTDGVDHENAAERASPSPAATRALADRLGQLCRGGELLLLSGDLGSGKTCFIQGLATGLGVDPAVPVTSPTFTIHAEYPGRLVLNHLDLYRLEEPEALAGLGLDDLLADPAAVTAIEWPELLGAGAGREYLAIALTPEGPDRRRIAAAARGRRHRELLHQWLKAEEE
ncbi:MAG: tRNA (adenosine(37)-N6)-threonylcarbamoyltransferase complex ATPase subunit type 1 TsaE [Planctomycetes bacterium]|nr:tRNA (adenosine(37)-N6)-threonylcarbamoyltransferase complex ATPase subunit type 1 TsaE [Planctomycetota bacterium]